MEKFLRKSRKSDQVTGSTVSAGKPRSSPPELTLITYGADLDLGESKPGQATDCLPFDPAVPVSWLNIAGTLDAELLEELGETLNIHHLILEDIRNIYERPKYEDNGDLLFLEINNLLWDKENGGIEAEQISMVMSNNYLVTFQESAEDGFEPIRKRLREGKSRLSSRGPDYLAYALIDAVVDHYFIVLEQIGDQIEHLEEQLVVDPTPETLHAIHDLKRELIYFRKSVWPLREVVSALERGESILFQQTSLVYLRDVYDHVIQVIETVETYREMVSGMLDIYLSSVSNRLNEVMKVLTIIATLFIPLSFVVGLYGMNFKYMPELNWKWGYPMVWGVILSTVIGMMSYFRRKKWL